MSSTVVNSNPSAAKAACILPQTRKSRLVEVPIDKSLAGLSLVVVSESKKDIYSEIENLTKKEPLGEEG